MRNVTLSLAAAVALGAIVTEPALAAPPMPSWTGFYIGVNAGYGWNDQTVRFDPDNQAGAHALGATNFAPPYNTQAGHIGGTGKGWFGGLQVGFNRQFDRHWLIGLEADLNLSGLDGSGSVLVPNILFPFGTMAEITASQNVSWFGTLRPRLGWLANENLLLFATGGLAFGQIKQSAAYTGVNVGFDTIYAFDNSGIRCNLTFTRDTCMIGESSRTKAGWTVGGGGEYRVPGTSASVKVEYLYVNLGGDEATHVVNTSSIPGTARGSFAAIFSGVDFHTVRFGVNWRL